MTVSNADGKVTMMAMKKVSDANDGNSVILMTVEIILSFHLWLKCRCCSHKTFLFT